MRRKILKITVLAMSLGIIGGIAGIAWRASVPHVEEIVPSRGLAIDAVYATGTVEPENWSRVGPVTPGRIAEILVEEGDSVRLGQPLARLDDREARARVAELEAKAAYWREERERSRTLAERGFRSKENHDKAQSEYQQAVSAIAAARQRRADLVVTAPRDGTVLRRDGEPGEVVRTDDTLFWIGSPRPLRITADVDEEDIARLVVGQTVLIKADAFPDQVVQGAIARITPKGDPVNKTFRVRISLPEETPLKVGMTCEVNVVTQKKNDALLVPATAVTGRSVLTVRDGRVVDLPVTLGIQGKDKIEILDGLAEDTPVIAAPPAGVKPGTKVRTR